MPSRKPQHLTLAVELTHEALLRVDGPEGDADMMRAEEIGGERVGSCGDRAEGPLGKILGGLVQPGEIVAAIMQEVAHLFEGA